LQSEAKIYACVLQSSFEPQMTFKAKIYPSIGDFSWRKLKQIFVQQIYLA